MAVLKNKQAKQSKEPKRNQFANPLENGFKGSSSMFPRLSNWQDHFFSLPFCPLGLPSLQVGPTQEASWGMFICQLDNLSPYCCRPKTLQTCALQQPHTHFSSTLPTSSHPPLRANSLQAPECLKDRERTFTWGRGQEAKHSPWPLKNCAWSLPPEPL